MIIGLVGWFAGDFLSEKFSKGENVIMGDFNALIIDKPALYVVKGCSACKLAKAFIEEHDINVEIRIINTNPRWASDLKELGLSSVPVLMEKDKVTVGFSESDYLSLK